MSIDNLEHTQSEEQVQAAHSPAPPSPSDDYLYEQVKRYRAWLKKQREHAESEEERQIAETYAHNASQVVVVGEQNVQGYAPFRYKYSALKVITRKQIIVMSVLFVAWLLSIFLFGKAIFVVTMGIITCAYLLHLVLDVALSLSIVRDSPEERIDSNVLEALRDADWPIYTILCPLYKEARVVPQFVKAMQGLDYPVEKLQILFLTEEDDKETRAAIENLDLPPHFEIVTVPDGTPRTKPRACNFGLIQSIGQYVVIYDAEDVPDPLQLKKAVLTFANHGSNLACVQAKLNFYNPDQNLLTRWFTAEYSLWFDLILPGLQKAHFLLPLGGTSNHFPTQTIRALGGWDAFNVTEDCDLGLRLAWFKLETVVLDSTTYEEANSRTKSWLRQRSRWIKGYMQTYLVHMREPWHYARHGRFREFLAMQLMIGGKTAVLFINPILWIALLISQLLRPFIGNVYAELFPAPLVAIGEVCLVVGNFFYLYIYLLACIRRRHYSLVKWTLLIPLYWLLMSAAACIAFYQLIVKPHYWEKTEHGLHLLNAKDMSIILEKDGIALQHHVHTTPIEHHNRVPLPAQERHRLNSAEFPSVQRALNSIHNAPAPAFTPREIVALRHAQHPIHRDPWAFATLLIAFCIGISTSIYSAINHIPAFVTSSTSWSTTLPMTNIITFPFTWSSTLMQRMIHTGTINQFSMYVPILLCYLVSSISIFIAARSLTRDSRASFIGTLLFLLNPTLLSFNALALNEWLSLATLTLTCCCFLLWMRSNSLSFLIGAAMSSLLATLTSYDGWALFVALLLFLLVAGLLMRQPRAQIESYMIAFGTLGALGIGVWIMLCGTVFGDPLAFFHVADQSTSQKGVQLALFDLTAPVQTLGPLVVAVALLAIALFFVRRRSAPDMLGVLAFLVPFLFSLILAFSGTNLSIFVPFAASTDVLHALQQQAGIATIAPASLFLATLIGSVMHKKGEVATAIHNQ